MTQRREGFLVVKTQSKNDSQFAIQARMGRHSLCRGRQAPVMFNMNFKGPKGRHSNQRGLSVCLVPGGLRRPARRSRRSNQCGLNLCRPSGPFCVISDHTGGSATGRGCVGLPGLNRIRISYTESSFHCKKSFTALPMNAVNSIIEQDDLEDVPFNSIGGLGRAYELFGDKLNAILDELNMRLAA